MTQRGGGTEEAIWDGSRFVLSESKRAWTSARVLVRQEEIRRARSWGDVVADHTVVVNLGGLTTEFEVEVDGGLRSLQPPTVGYMSILPAGTAFAGMFQGRTNTYAIWHMHISELKQIAAEAGIERTAELLPRLSHRDEKIHAGIKRLAELTDCEDNLCDILGESINRALGLHLMSIYDASAVRVPVRTANPILSPDNSKVLQDYVNEHLAEKITLDDLAAVVDQTVHNLLMGFHQRFRKTPYQYIIDERLKRAQWQLAHTSKSISAIAYDVGFSSQSHLTTMFKKYIRTTPLAYRKAST